MTTAEQRDTDYIIYLLSQMDNAAMFDYWTRHQIYLEGVKLTLASLFDDVYVGCESLALAIISQFPDDTGDLSKSDVRRATAKFNAGQQRLFGRWHDDLKEALKELMAIDVILTMGMLVHEIQKTAHTEVGDGTSTDGEVENEDTPQTVPSAEEIWTATHDVRKHATLAGPAKAFDSEDSNNQLWAIVLATPLGASGQTVDQMLTQFAAAMGATFYTTVQRAWRNHNTQEELQAALVGGRERKGLVDRWRVYANSTTATIIQHTSVMAQGAIGSIALGKYRWASIIDNKTTEICLSLNGKVFRWGEGPLPPIHWYCRSHVYPYNEASPTHDIPDSLRKWLDSQPRRFLKDAFKSNETDIQPITLTQFRQKLPFITED